MWLTTLCLVFVADGFAAATSPAVQSAKTQAVSGECRALTALSLDLNRLLKQNSQARSPAEQQAAIISLTNLYREMMQHDLRNEHEFLKNMAAQLRSRLVRVRDDLQRQIAREERLPSASQEAVAPSLDDEQIALRHSLAVSLAMSDQTLGTPALAFSSGGGAILESNGRALVELIERTINPAFWDTNGGTGTVFYYAPLQCLVVVATGHIHEEIGGLLDGVRE